MSERGMYLPLTWNEEERGMGVYLPVSNATPEVVPEGPEFEHPLYLVETISTFRIRYVVSARSSEHAADTVVMQEAAELSQKHVDENIIGVRQIDHAEYLRLFAEENGYLESWDQEQKFKFVHVVDYDK